MGILVPVAMSPDETHFRADVRNSSLRVPKNLKLSQNVKELLERLGLSPNDFDVKDYSYVDSAMYELSKDC